MKDIAIIIPVHALNGSDEEKLLINAISNVDECRKYYSHNLNVYVVSPNEIDSNILGSSKLIINNGETDFCSQVNFGVNNITEDYFSILEFDDTYHKKWFSMVEKYQSQMNDVSVFLPINIQIISKDDSRQFGNELPWASSISEEMGFIDFKCLQSFVAFNITGGVFNKSDYLSVGGLKSNIKVGFVYEYLLRMVHNKKRIFVVPKEGYKHVIGRENSFIDKITKEYSNEDLEKWFKIASTEYTYNEDRKVDIEKTEDNDV